MSSLNKVQLIGRCGEDPSIHTFDNGNKVASFSFAVSEKYKNKEGERVENVEWMNIKIFGKLCDIVEKYVRKGDLLYLEGKLTTRSYEDKDGKRKYITEIVCFSMQMLDTKNTEKKEVNEFPDISEVPPPDMPF